MKRNISLLGLQWGDEGKGKVVDNLAKDLDAAVRYQGGHNAGHTLIVNGKKIVFHLFYPYRINLLKLEPHTYQSSK